MAALFEKFKEKKKQTNQKTADVKASQRLHCIRGQ